MAAVRPSGINHVVINVRDMEESHRFWTEMLGFVCVGEVHATPQRPNPPKMRFYSGDHGDGALTHHDVALVENTAIPPPGDAPCAVNHIALALPNREAFVQQLTYLQQHGVKFERRIEHGVTHSLYIRDPNGYGVELLYELPRERWAGNIDEAVNFAVTLPTEGPEALQDNPDPPVFAAPQPV